MPRPTFETVADYIAAQPPPTRAALKKVRATIRKALPRATEGISYQIPIYKLDGVMVLYFAGYANHYSIYPATPKLLAALGKKDAARLQHKATLRFSLDEPVPVRLITRIAKLRAAETREVGRATGRERKAR
jgi:uncharacterized protein YdhG (YjbR/CyaY superfamily)